MRHLVVRRPGGRLPGAGTQCWGFLGRRAAPHPTLGSKDSRPPSRSVLPGGQTPDGLEVPAEDGGFQSLCQCQWGLILGGGDAGGGDQVGSKDFIPVQVLGALSDLRRRRGLLPLPHDCRGVNVWEGMLGILGTPTAHT